MLRALADRGFEVMALHHAEAILVHDMPEALSDLERVLADVTVSPEELVRGGGGETGLTQRLRRSFCDRGWLKRNFEIKKIVDGVERESISHEVDHVKSFDRGTFALEIEWNNKDPFFDRDLENFKRLHAEGAISVGGIITRGESLNESLREIVEFFALQRGINRIEEARAYYDPTARQVEAIQKQADKSGNFEKSWAKSFVSDKFAESTTHWRKLEDRVRRGVGNPCPLLLIGLPRSIVQ
jgi:hypothetical protein